MVNIVVKWLILFNSPFVDLSILFVECIKTKEL